MTERSAWGKEDIGTVDEIKSGTVDVVRDKRSAAGTVSTGAASASVPSGTIDVSGFNKFTLSMVNANASGTVQVQNDIQLVPGGPWGSIDVVTVKNNNPMVKEITAVGDRYRPVPQAASTLTVVYRGRA